MRHNCNFLVLGKISEPIFNTIKYYTGKIDKISDAFNLKLRFCYFLHLRNERKNQDRSSYSYVSFAMVVR